MGNACCSDCTNEKYDPQTGKLLPPDSKIFNLANLPDSDYLIVPADDRNLLLSYSSGDKKKIIQIEPGNLGE